MNIKERSELKMKTLVIGSDGYVGPVTCSKLEEISEVIRLDAGWFGQTSSGTIKGDIRYLLDEIDYSGLDCVVYLAAVSNDPMGKNFAEITHEINHHAAVQVAQRAKKNHVRKFVYASSCSAYGAGSDKPRKEVDQLNPLTDYAQSKVNAELDLIKLADPDFNVYCLRFATACGASTNLRLDLVVNDFVASALTRNKIKVLSNGEPYRPLIAVDDMALAIKGVSLAKNSDKKFANIYNVGSEKFTYRIRDLAYEVSRYLSFDPEVEINHSATHDDRSYKVNFDQFNSDFPNFVPKQDLQKVVNGLERQIGQLINVHGSDYTNWIPHIRLNALKLFLENKNL
jgi:nucleoside-diphosphate-sugar epimerase